MSVSHKNIPFTTHKGGFKVGNVHICLWLETSSEVPFSLSESSSLCVSVISDGLLSPSPPLMT